MSFLGNVSHAISTSTLGLLDKYPVICEKSPGFCGLKEDFFNDYQRTLLIGTLAASAITAVGGLYGMFLNRDGTLAISALFFTTSALGTAALWK